jgi:hypothetical protein
MWDHQPTTIKQPPSTNHHQPATIKQPPSTNHHQPTTINQPIWSKVI